MKLQSKILIAIFATLMIFASVTLLSYYYFQKRETVANVKESNTQLSKIASYQLDQKVKEWSSTLVYLQNHKVFNEYLEAKVAGTLKAQPGKKAALEELFLASAVSRPELIQYIRFIDKDGMEEVLVKNQQIRKEYKDRTDRIYYSEVIDAPPFKMNRPSFRTGEDYTAMDWGMAVSYKNRTLGVLSMTLNPSHLSQMFNSLLIKGIVDDAYLVTWDGRYLFNTRNAEKTLAETAVEHAEAYTALMAGKTGAIIDSNDGEVMSYASHEPSGVRFMFATSHATMTASIMTMLKRTALLLLLSSVPLGLVIIYITRKMIVSRLYFFSKTMSKASQEYMDGSASNNKVHDEIKAMALKEKDEIGDLSRSFLMMSERLDTELHRLQSLVKFGRLVGDEISEAECYSILIQYLLETFKIDKIVIISLNNSENLAEVVASYGAEEGELSYSKASSLEVLQDVRLCRAVRSGQDFVVMDVEADYRCPHQEVAHEHGSYMCTPVSTGGTVLGWLHLVSFEKNFFTSEKCFTINSYISTIAPAISSMRLLKSSQKMAIRDPLTGLYNRRYLKELICGQLSLAARYKQPISFIMLDVDHFKRVNDIYGHQQGDKVLQLISAVLTEHVRDSDTISRYGGEEFTIVLPNTDKDGGYKLAEKIRSAVENSTVINVDGIKKKTTISLGVSTYPEDGVDMDALLRQADIALYQSKATGRNKVTAASVLLTKNAPSMEVVSDEESAEVDKEGGKKAS